MRKQNRGQQNCRSIFRKLLRSIPHRPDDAARWKHDPKCSSSRTVISAAHPWLQACSIILIYLYLYISIHALSILTNHYDDTSRKQNKITIFLAPKVNDRWFKTHIDSRIVYTGRIQSNLGRSEPAGAESAAIRNSLQQLIQSTIHGSGSNSRL